MIFQETTNVDTTRWNISKYWQGIYNILDLQSIKEGGYKEAEQLHSQPVARLEPFDLLYRIV